jgi:F-type H+-transporting ATPase subunit epsilon
MESRTIQPRPDSANLAVKILTPEQIVWQGSAQAVSSHNSVGPFDILPEHANMITFIESQPIEVVTAEGSKTFTFEKAVLSVRNNNVSVFADILIPTK